VSEPSIRPAEPRDAAAIATCHVRTWQVAYRDQLPDDFLDALSSTIEQRTQFWDRVIRAGPGRGQHQMVAVDDGAVVGFVTFGPPDEPSIPGAGELYAIYLDPTHWGRGYGRALMHVAERGLADAGFSEAYLWVLETNTRARRFYEIAGWVADGGRKTEHRGDVELREVRYRRSLAPDTKELDIAALKRAHEGRA
jgi:ribosomal protein S18 acetylase RimI-like enzyme